MLFPIDYKTMALLAIVTGLVILCMGLWYVWNTQQMLGTEVQYLRNQHIAIQEQLKKSTLPIAKSSLPVAQASPLSSVSNVNATYEMPSTCVSSMADAPTEQSTALSTDADDVLHRSYQVINSVNGVSQCLVENQDEEESSSAEDDESDGFDDDDDQHVDHTDLVNPIHALQTNTKEDVDNEDTNHLVESILSNIVSESVEQQTMADTTELQNASTESTNDLQTDDSVAEDFLENSGNYTALADSLRTKTVVELKKMCADYDIGLKKGKTYLKKEELIEELVVKMPVH